MCYCPTPTLHLNLALTGDGAFLFSLKKTHSVWFISVLNYGDTENFLINHLLLVIPMSYPCHYTNLCPHKPHKHAHTHTLWIKCHCVLWQTYSIESYCVRRALVKILPSLLASFLPCFLPCFLPSSERVSCRMKECLTICTKESRSVNVVWLFHKKCFTFYLVYFSPKCLFTFNLVFQLQIFSVDYWTPL